MHNFVYNYREIEYDCGNYWKSINMKPDALNSPISEWIPSSEYLREYELDYGKDALAIYDIFIGFAKGPLDEDSYEENELNGVFHFLRKLDRTVKENKDSILSNKQEDEEEYRYHQDMLKALAAPVQKNHSRAYVALLMEYCNQFFQKAIAGKLCLPVLKDYLIMLAPLAPFHAESEWQTLQLGRSVFKNQWPQADVNYAKTGLTVIPVQLNGKTKLELELGRDEALENARHMAIERILEKQLAGKETLEDARFIYVPGKIINIIF